MVLFMVVYISFYYQMFLTVISLRLVYLTRRQCHWILVLIYWALLHYSLVIRPEKDLCNFWIHNNLRED